MRGFTVRRQGSQSFVDVYDESTAVKYIPR